MLRPTKLCPHCGIVKERIEFYPKYKGSHLIATICKKCSKQLYHDNKDQRRIYNRKRNNIPEVKAAAVKRATSHRNKKYKWLLEFYGTDKMHCERCRYDASIAAIQFHHLNPKEKENVGDSFSKWIRKISFEKFQEKIVESQLVPLCANCHAELHAGLWKYGE